MTATAQVATFRTGSTSVRDLWIRRQNETRARDGEPRTFAAVLRENERTTETQVSAQFALERAIQKEVQGKGLSLAKSTRRPLAQGTFEPTEDEHPTIAAMHETVELNRASNMHYLEVQNRYQWMSNHFTCLSNLLRVRSESTRKCITEVK